MRVSGFYIILLLVTGIVNTTLAQNQVQAASWDRASAMAAVRSINIDLAIGGVRDLNDLQAIEHRKDWPLPAREAAIYKFTRGLAGQSRDTVTGDIMQYLLGYQSRILVPHEDHGDALIPLYNIRGAAAGIEHGWIRSESADEARLVLTHDPAALVAGYLESTKPSQRSGYLDAVAAADLPSVQIAQAEALKQLAGSPELTRLLAATAIKTTDPSAIRRLLVDGRGDGLAPALAALGLQTSPLMVATMLKFAIEQAPTGNASLAIAAWWPPLRNDAATRQLMTDRLGDPALGACVALALARKPDIQTIRELQHIAGGDSIAAQRAQLALNINRDGLFGEAQK